MFWTLDGARYQGFLSLDFKMLLTSNRKRQCSKSLDRKRKQLLKTWLPDLNTNIVTGGAIWLLLTKGEHMQDSCPTCTITQLITLFFFSIVSTRNCFWRLSKPKNPSSFIIKSKTMQIFPSFYLSMLTKLRPQIKRALPSPSHEYCNLNGKGVLTNWILLGNY